MADSELLSQLNAEQREAVCNTDGALLILAGAGSGKTRVIAHRIAYLISEKGVPPWNILAVTFTNKAAEEMRLRVQRLLRGLELSSAPLVSTFHSLCVRILRQDIEKLNDKYTRTFTIYDQDDSLRLIKQCIKDLGYDEKYLGPRATQSAISSAKNRGEDAEAFTSRAQFVQHQVARNRKKPVTKGTARCIVLRCLVPQPHKDFLRCLLRFRDAEHMSRHRIYLLGKAVIHQTERIHIARGERAARNFCKPKRIRFFTVPNGTFN